MTELSVIEGGEKQVIRAFDPTGYIDAFIAAQDVKDKSKETYRKALKQFFIFFVEQANAQPQMEDILAYKAYLRDKEYSAYTITCYLTAVRKFFEWAESKKIYPNIAKSVKGAKKPHGFRKECLTVSQVKSVLGNVERLTLQGKRDYALLNLLVRTGLRTIEAQRANIEDIRQEGGEAVLYVQGKGRDTKDSFVLLTDETLNPIREYLNARGKTKDKDALFSSISNKNSGGRMTTRSISRIVKNFLRMSGINSNKITAHSFRHTAITFSLIGGASVQEAKAFARHSDINTTMIYAHNIDRIASAPERRIDNVLLGAH